MGAPFHGKNGLVYISGTLITGANEWRINIATESVETPQLGDTWKKRVVGHSDWSGSITAWMHDDSKVITNAAVAGTSVALLIYPKRADLTDYFTGNAIFGASMGGGSGSAVGRDGDFVGDDTLTIAGFS